MNRNDKQYRYCKLMQDVKGELVARWIINTKHISKPMQDYGFLPVTDKRSKEGFKNLKCP